MAEAVHWYRRIRPGLESDFALCVEHALDRISERPESFPLVHAEVRRALLRRFPYGVLFRIRQHDIEILAVFHLRRDPANLACTITVRP